MFNADERAEIYDDVLELAAEGMGASEIADILNIGLKTVYYICRRAGVPFRKAPKIVQRALTKEEYGHFRRLRKKGVSLNELEKIFNVDRMFLSKIEKKKQIKLQCVDCPAPIKVKKGLKRCPECKRRLERDRKHNERQKKYENDPIFRKKEIARIYAYEKRRKGLT